MRRLLAGLAAAVLLAGLGPGCANEKDKGINSNRDRPIAEPHRPAAEREKPATEPHGSEPAKGATAPGRDSGR